MKVLSIATFSAIVATAAAAPCNIGEIQGKLYPNATDGLKTCAANTGFDIWTISGFPTKDQANKIMTDRTCVDFLNQINERANKEIQCDIDIGGTQKGFGPFIVDLLTGKTGNETASSNSSSGSMSSTGSGSLSIEKTNNTAGSGSTSLLPSTSASGSGASKTKTTPKPSPTPTPTSAASTVSAVAAGCVAVIGLAMH